MRKIMTDEQYEQLIGQLASEFYDRYMANPNNESSENLEIAVEYTTFILSRFASMVEEFENG
jgi:hypothetical protein